MRDDEAKTLGLRAVACPGWRWLRGMALGPDGWQVVVQRADALASEGLELAHRDGRWSMDPEQVAGVGPFAEDGPRWPDFRDPATMGAAIALWQARPGHTYRCPCPVLTYAAVYGLTDRRTIMALVEAMEAAPARVQP